MTGVRRYIVFIIIAGTVIYGSSCKKKEIFVEPSYIFLKWSNAIKNLNYRDYSECEAFPKDNFVFRDLYRDYYYTNIVVSEIGTYDKNDIKVDSRGDTYTRRRVFFECSRVSRKTDRMIQDMKGDIEFIKYTEGSRSEKGWLMYNRTIIGTGSVKK